MPEHSLFPTKHRKAFLRAVNERGRVIRYHSTGDAFDNKESTLVNARLAEAFGEGWIEPVPEADLWERAHSKAICTYYRLSPAGARVLGVATDSIEEKSNG